MSWYPKKKRVRIATKNSEPTRTKQEFRDQADIHSILARYTRSGVLDWAQRTQPTYGSFDGGMDYATARMRVQEAQDEFMELPAAIRERFDNDPLGLIEFLEDEGNREEAEELGLIAREAAPESDSGGDGFDSGPPAEPPAEPPETEVKTEP